MRSAPDAHRYPPMRHLQDLHEKLDQLQADLISAAGDGTASWGRFKKEAVAWAWRFRARMVGFAESEGHPVDRVLRNLVATRDYREMEPLKVLIRFWRHSGRQLDEIEVLKELISTMPSRKRGLEVLAYLLLGKHTPEIEKAAAFVRGSIPLTTAYAVEVLGVNHSSSPVKTATVMNLVHGHGASKCRQTFHELMIKFWFGRGLPKLDRNAYYALDNALRPIVLSDARFAEAALQPDFFEAFKARPLDFPDSQESIIRRQWLNRDLPQALSDLRRRSFGTVEVEKLFARPDLEQYEGSVLTALSEQPEPLAGWTGSRPAQVLLKPEYASRVKNPELGRALLFFSLPVAERLSVVDGLTNGQILEFVAKVTAGDFARAAVCCRCRRQLSDLKELIVSQENLLECLRRDLDPGRKVSYGVLGDLMLTNPVTDEITRYLKATPAALAWLDSAAVRAPAIRNFFVEHCTSRRQLTRVLEDGDPGFLSGVFSRANGWLDEWRQLLAKEVARIRSFRAKGRFICAALSDCPDLVEQAFGWRISAATYGVVWSLIGKFTDDVAVHARLVKFTDSKGRPHWESCMMDRHHSRFIGQVIPAGVPALRERWDQLEAQRLLKDKAFRDKLRAVLEGRQMAATLRCRRRLLPHMIPWVRKHWRKKPTLVVAFEIALHLSLADARFLAFLCARRWACSDRGVGGRAFDSLYSTYERPKKSGGKRIVTVPEERLKRLQRRLLVRGFDRIPLHPAAHGFIRGRSIRTNALPHVKQSVVANVDIESFFPNTPYRRILRACSLLFEGKLSNGAQRALADICSYGGALPTGAPTSPAIANLVLRSADAAISKAAGRNGIIYTRYADDLTVSGGDDTLRILPFVRRVLAEHGYRLDDKKTNIYRRGRRQIVTGLVVNEKPNLPRRTRRRLRAAAHRAASGGDPFWHGRPMSGDELSGRLAFLQLVQPEEAGRLKSLIKAGNPRSGEAHRDDE